ncbi:MAG TPA: winged helix-turn-helix domain-containing protein, partial [Thermoanaerobaculia bacterium]|nr:winged helix-turn-helix domain-containing protein [Thermoanaerobaculia bacterium]
MRPQTRELIGSAGTIRLKPRPMDVLVNLAEHAGQLRTREEVLADVWGDIAISEEVLTHCIWELRNALGDDRREPRFIETLHRSGYRLIAPVIPVDDDTGPLEVIPATEDERELASLRGRVQRFWIEQVLDRSLSQSEILTIDAEERPELVKHPWAGVRPPPLAASPRAVIPPGENILA